MKLVEDMSARPQSSHMPSLDYLLVILRVVVFLQCLGVAGRYLLSEFEVESDVFGCLYFDLDWSELAAKRVDDAGAIACLIGGFLILLPLQKEWFCRCQRLALVPIMFWMVALAATPMIRGGLFSELSLGEHAVRYAASLALMALWTCDKDQKPSADQRPITNQKPRWRRSAIAILLVACTVTFTVHGYKAIEQYGQFSDLILMSDANWTRFGLDETMVNRVLLGIGIIDLLAAAMILIPNTIIRSTAISYMLVWGLITAASRMTAMGIIVWPETLIRSANWGCPLALLVYFVVLSRHK